MGYLINIISILQAPVILNKVGAPHLHLQTQQALSLAWDQALVEVSVGPTLAPTLVSAGSPRRRHLPTILGQEERSPPVGGLRIFIIRLGGNILVF